MNNKTFGLLLLNLFLFNFVHSDDLTVSDILKKMRENESKISDLQLQISQQVEFTNVKEKYESESKLIYKKPRKIYYEQYRPQKIQVVSNGNKLFLYNEVNKQVFVDNWKSWKGIDYFIPGFFDQKGNISYLEKYCEIELKNKESNLYVLYIKPKKKIAKSKYFSDKFEFYLWIDDKEFYPRKSKFMSDNVVSTTEIKSWGININPEEAIFEFKIPENVEVLRLPK